MAIGAISGAVAAVDGLLQLHLDGAVLLPSLLKPEQKAILSAAEKAVVPLEVELADLSHVLLTLPEQQEDAEEENDEEEKRKEQHQREQEEQEQKIKEEKRLKKEAEEPLKQISLVLVQLASPQAQQHHLQSAQPKQQQQTIDLGIIKMRYS